MVSSKKLLASSFRLRASRGFTLIELLVVIAIIGILSSVVLASLNTARVKARDTKRIADIKSIQLAMEFYYDANGFYPSAIGSLVGSTNGASLARLPTDPSSNVNYLYAYKTVGSSVTAFAVGANLETLAGVTTLDDGDVDLTITETGGWLVEGAATTIDGDDADDCAGTAGTGLCYDVSNVNAP